MSKIKYITFYILLHYEYIITWTFSKYDLKFQVKHKNNICFFLKLFFSIHPKSSNYSRKCHYFFFFFFENESFTLSSSFSPSFYNISIAINTLATMNNQFEAFNPPKFRFLLFIYLYLCTQITSFTLSSSSKNPRF